MIPPPPTGPVPVEAMTAEAKKRDRSARIIRAPEGTAAARVLRAGRAALPRDGRPVRRDRRNAALGRVRADRLVCAVSCARSAALISLPHAAGTWPSRLSDQRGAHRIAAARVFQHREELVSRQCREVGVRVKSPSARLPEGGEFGEAKKRDRSVRTMQMPAGTCVRAQTCATGLSCYFSRRRLTRLPAGRGSNHPARSRS
jgi:hypothetical protein